MERQVAPLLTEDQMPLVMDKLATRMFFSAEEATWYVKLDGGVWCQANTGMAQATLSTVLVDTFLPAAQLDKPNLFATAKTAALKPADFYSPSKLRPALTAAQARLTKMTTPPEGTPLVGEFEQGEKLLPLTNGYLRFHLDGTTSLLPLDTPVFHTAPPVVELPGEETPPLHTLPIWNWMVATYGLDQLSLLQEMFGSILSYNRVGVHGFLLLYGEAGAGKGVTMAWLRSLLPMSMAWTSPMRAEDLTSRFGLSGHRQANLLLLDEYTAAGTTEEAAAIKRISALEPVLYEVKGGAQRTAQMRGMLVFVANSMPDWKDDTEGALLRRFHAIRLLQVANGYQFGTVVNSWMPEAREAMLLWALQGNQHLALQGHFTATQESELEASILRDHLAPTSSILRAAFTRSADGMVSAEDVMAVLEGAGHPFVSARKIQQLMNDAGFPLRRAGRSMVGGVRFNWYQGAEINDVGRQHAEVSDRKPSWVLAAEETHG